MTGKRDIKAGLRVVMAIAVLGAVLVLPAQALAADDCSNATNDPTAAQYCPPSEVQVGGQTTQGGSGGGSVTPSSDSSGTEAVSTSGSGGSLPFTGLDVGILLLVGGVLTGTGLLLRRLTAHDRQG